MKKLVASFLYILVLLALFTVGTYAWFFDQATNTDNIIQIGNLKLSADVSTGLESFGSGEDAYYDLKAADLVDIKSATSSIFDFEGRVQPGDTMTRYVRIENVGTILMGYRFEIEVEEDYMGEYIEFTITPYSSLTGLPLGSAVTLKGDALALSGNLYRNELGLDQTEFDLIRIDLKISETITNDYNLTTVSESAFNFDLVITAWQADYPESEPQ